MDLVAMPHSNMLITYIKYEPGEEIILGVIRKSTESKKMVFDMLF